MISTRKIPSDFQPPYSVNAVQRPGKRDRIEIYNDNYVIAVVESGTFREGHAVAELIVNAVNKAWSDEKQAA